MYGVARDQILKQDVFSLADTSQRNNISFYKKYSPGHTKFNENQSSLQTTTGLVFLVWFIQDKIEEFD